MQKDRISKMLLIAGVPALLTAVVPFLHLSASQSLIDSSSSGMFFVPNAAFVEPYLSSDAQLEALELSRLLNQEKSFPQMHRVVEGNGVIISLQRSGSPQQQESPHYSFWSEEITLQIPSYLPAKSTIQSFGFPESKGYCSWYFGRLTTFHGIAEKGTISVSVLDDAHMSIDMDVFFKRLDVDPEIYLIDSETEKLLEEKLLKQYGVIEVNQGASIGNQTIRIKERFVAERKVINQLPEESSD